MYYCPKCQKTYENTVQRFCLDDGRRLVRASSDDKSSEPTNGVFKNILSRKIETDLDTFAAPRFSRARLERFEDAEFLPSFEAEIFEVNSSFETENESVESAFEAVPFSESAAEINDEIEDEPKTGSRTEVAPDIESKFAADYEFAPEFDVYSEAEPEIETEVEDELKFEDESALLEAARQQKEHSFDETVLDDAKIKDEKVSETQAIEKPVLESEIVSGLRNNSTTEIENPATRIVEGKAAAQTAGKSNRAMFAILGAAILLLGGWLVWSFLPNRAVETEPIAINQPNANVVNQTAANAPIVNANVLPANETASRSIIQPPNTNYFQNGKANLKDEALKNYLGFSLYYPKNWRINETNGGDAEKKTRGTFLDISKNADSGTPVEQFIASYYDSKGTFETDTKNFSEEVIETNRALNKIIPNYVVVSEGEKQINDNLRVYEIKFKGTGTTPAGEKLTLWGKRLFIPAEIKDAKNGYMITMLATSLSKDVKSVEDVGVKGELPQILNTFVPNPNL